METARRPGQETRARVSRWGRVGAWGGGTLLALVGLGMGARADPAATGPLLTAVLIGAIVAAYQFPLAVRPRTKVYMASVPYYLLAALVAPPLAATAAGLGALLGELAVRRRRGTYPGDIAREVARRVPVELLGAGVAHLALGGTAHLLALVGAGVALGVGDILTAPLVLTPQTGEPPGTVVRALAREATAPEAAQYLLGLLGALAAARVPWAPLLLVPPTALVYGAFRWLLEQQRATEALLRREREAYARAEAALRVRDDFLLTAAHELRTPLTVILGHGALVEGRLERGEPIAPAALGAHMAPLGAAARRMLTTIEGMTDAADVRMGQALALRAEVVDLGAVARAVVAAARVAGPAGAAPIAVDAALDVRVTGDRARLERVTRQLIDNAVTYSPAGGPVAVAVARAGSDAVLVVRDRGVGIPAAALARLFTPDDRATTARGRLGTGLGLAGAKAIVEGHGGTIAVASVAGQGTTVRVTLPGREDTGADATDGADGVEHPDAVSPPPRRRASDRCAAEVGPGAALAARSDGGNGTKKEEADRADRADVPRRV